MTSIKAMWTGGSLFTRTLLHVATFVAGSLAFVCLMSFVLISTAKGLLAAGTGAPSASASAPQNEPGATKPYGAMGARGSSAVRPSAKPRRIGGGRGGAVTED